MLLAAAAVKPFFQLEEAILVRSKTDRQTFGAS